MIVSWTTKANPSTTNGRSRTLGGPQSLSAVRLFFALTLPVSPVAGSHGTVTSCSRMPVAPGLAYKTRSPKLVLYCPVGEIRRGRLCDTVPIGPSVGDDDYWRVLVVYAVPPRPYLVTGRKGGGGVLTEESTHRPGRGGLLGPRQTMGDCDTRSQTEITTSSSVCPVSSSHDGGAVFNSALSRAVSERPSPHPKGQLHQMARVWTVRPGQIAGYPHESQDDTSGSPCGFATAGSCGRLRAFQTESTPGHQPPLFRADSEGSVRSLTIVPDPVARFC